MSYINRESKLITMAKERSQSIVEVLKYSFGYFLAQFSLVFAVMFTLALFDPLNGFFAVPIQGYMDAAKLAAVVGAAGGIVGFVSAIDRATDAEIDLFLLPNTVKDFTAGGGSDSQKISDRLWICKSLNLYVVRPTSWKSYFRIAHW